MRRGVLYIVLGCLASILAGCEFRTLEDPVFNTKVNIAVNVATVLNVTCDIYNEKIPVPEIYPEAMHVLFYEQDGDALISESFITGKTQNSEGGCVMHGNVNVLPGTYKMLIYSFGEVDTSIENYKSWSRIQAKAMEASEYYQEQYATSMEKGGRNAQHVTYMPNHIVVARNEEEVIPYHSGDHTIKAEAKTVVDTYYLQVKVEGMEYVNGAYAYLSGMASGNLLATDTRVESPEAIIYIPLLKSDDKGVPVICNVFNTFGRNNNAVNELAVTIDLNTIDGRTISRTFDITDLFYSEACIKHHWLLVEEVIKVEPPMGEGDGGFKPGVGDWEEEEHDIEIQ